MAGTRRSDDGRRDPDRCTTYPLILDEPPSPPDSLTHYDLIHGLLFARLLSAADSGLPWREAARTILLRDVEANVGRARQCWEAHLARARWLVTTGVELAARGMQLKGDSVADYPLAPVPEPVLASAGYRPR